MNVDPNTLHQYEGKQVILTVSAEDGTASEYIGKVEAASSGGMAFKEKGKRDVELVMPDSIIEIALAPAKSKTLPQKKLKPIPTAAVRQHLLDRHAMSRVKVNTMTDEAAEALHDEIDHDDLGHRHSSGEDEAVEAPEAVEAD